MDIKKNKNVQWIDVPKPTGKDLAWLKEEFDLHPVIADELRGPSARARVEAHGAYLFFVYYFPKYDTDDEASVRTEIDFIVTKNAVATVHYEPLTEALEHFEVKHEKNSLELLYRLVEHLVTHEERQLRHVREKVEAVGQSMFKGKEKEILERIMYLKRDISEYRIIVKLQEPILHSLLTKGKRFWNEDDTEVYLNDLIGDQSKVVRQLEDYRETVSDFEATNNQLMNLKTSSIMKTFTALSFLTFPFVLFATLFTMNTRDTPIVDLPGAFWIITGFIVIAIVILATYFRKKGWF
ncbi:MAG: CorA family divalent cation transporter [Minisyncoccia bacterium]|jgi:magnesium transporter